MEVGDTATVILLAFFGLVFYGAIGSMVFTLYRSYLEDLLGYRYELTPYEITKTVLSWVLWPLFVVGAAIYWPIHGTKQLIKVISGVDGSQFMDELRADLHLKPKEKASE